MFCIIASAAKQSPRSWPADRAQSVVPAKAGTHLSEARTAEGWVPAFAGTTVWGLQVADCASLIRPSGSNLTLGARACGGDDLVRIGSECAIIETHPRDRARRKATCHLCSPRK